MMGAFASVQATADQALVMHLRESNPCLAEQLRKQNIERLRDDERWDCIKALARAVNYEGDMNSASDAFWRSKRLRDAVGHGAAIELVHNRTTPEPHFLLLTRSRKGLPDPLMPVHFQQAAAECRWLVVLVKHLAWLGGATVASFAVSTRADGTRYLPYMEVLPPPDLPVAADWEPGSDLHRELPGEVGLRPRR
jgi:hypothetical protein